MAKRHHKSPSPNSPNEDDKANPDGAPDGEAAVPEVSNLENYLEQNRGKIGVLMVLSTVAIAVTAWVIYNRSVKREEAAIEFTMVPSLKRTDFKTEEEFNDAQLIEYNLVIDRHKGTVAGGNAAIMKAKLQWDADKKTESLKTLEQFLGNFPDHPLRAEGIYAVAVREASMGNADVAEKRLKEVVDQHSDSPIAAYAQVYLADMALGGGEVEEAKGLYEAAAKMDPRVVDVVERRMTAIKAKTPIVAIEAPPLPKEPEKPTDPVKPPTDPAKPPVEPAKPPTDPVKPPTDPAKPPTDPAKPPVEPVKPPVEPAKPPTDPVKPPTDPVKPPVEPAKPPTDPVKPPTDPAKPPTDPVKPPTDPVKPPVEPAKPPTDPVKPPVEPAKPPVEPAKPPVEPVKPE